MDIPDRRNISDDDNSRDTEGVSLRVEEIQKELGFRKCTKCKDSLYKKDSWWSKSKMCYQCYLLIVKGKKL